MNRPNVVEVKKLTVRFGDFTAVNDVSFSVRQGEIFGFLGANGAGKTTTIRVLCGLLLPSSGEVSVCGFGFEDGGAQVKKCVGYMSQKFTLYEDLTVEENLRFTASLRKLPDEIFNRRKQELFDFIGWRRPTNMLVREIAGGIRQQMSLVASLLHSPQMVFLDEPTAGVTPAARAKFWQLIRDLSTHGTTVFVTTHYMDEAEQCHRVALMRAGELIALSSPQSLKESTFPHGLIELDPLQEQTAEIVASLHRHPAVKMLEPYGRRFHLEINDSKDWATVRSLIEPHFRHRPIAASLEDVFIRRVEGEKR